MTATTTTTTNSNNITAKTEVSVVTMSTRSLVFSFFDVTGNAVRPWAEAGYSCSCLDIQNPNPPRIEHFKGGGSIMYVRADLSPGSDDWQRLLGTVEASPDLPIAMVFGWPPCTDLAVSGARHWARKRAADPEFQSRAVAMARTVETFAVAAGAPYLIENPVGALCTMWRSPDTVWHPYQYGGYLPEDDEHPTWPKYIAPRDGYTKATGAWTGGGFVMPEPKPVEPEVLERQTKSGRTLRGSRQFFFLGGSSLRTKNIRSATPRGFARAVFEANRARPKRVQRSAA